VVAQDDFFGVSVLGGKPHEVGKLRCHATKVVMEGADAMDCLLRRQC